MNVVVLGTAEATDAEPTRRHPTTDVPSTNRVLKHRILLAFAWSNATHLILSRVTAEAEPYPWLP